MGKRFDGSEETRDPRGCSMHILFQEVHNILEFRDRALERFPVWTDSFRIQMSMTPNTTSLHRHVCFTKLRWKLSQCHGLWCGTGLLHSPDTNSSLFRSFHRRQNELIQQTALSSDFAHNETRMSSYCDHERARSIADQTDSQEISTAKVLNDWTYELQSDTNDVKL